MMLREVLIFPEILTSRRVAKLKPFAQLFYRNLMHVCDGAGVFENDPELLCNALYPRARHAVTPEAIAKWLKECHEAGLIRFHTDDQGRPLGEFTTWLQRDTRRRQRYRHSKDRTPDELPFEDGPPDPPPPKKKRNGMEGKRREDAPLPTMQVETDQAWMARVQAANPEVDVPGELRKALAKNPRAGRKYFEEQWLPNCERPIQLTTPTGAVMTVQPEPEAWRAYLKDHYEGESWAESAAASDWQSMPAHWRAKIAREMA